MYKDDFLNKKLNERKAQNALRQLRLPTGKIDFCSNDYLGIVHHSLIAEHQLPHSSGSTGSRLLAGNYALVEETEQIIANFHQSESALIFNSGYDANVGLLSAVAQKEDTIIYDALSHASIRDGVRLSFARSFSFLHNDLNDLEKKVKHATGNIFIVTESVFSMDGDICPLEELVMLCEKYQANLIIDEAHATGFIGLQGEGLVQSLRLQSRLFARVHTFGKACGCHGAVVLGSQKLRDYLINFARSFIYSTSLPAQSVAAIKNSYALFPAMQAERNHIHQLIQALQAAPSRFEKLNSATPIQAVVIPGNTSVKMVAAIMQENNLDIRPILYPTVAKNKERLRIVLHAHNTLQELEILMRLLK
jgi:8-amino-7-oxononanoate synthase